MLGKEIPRGVPPTQRRIGRKEDGGRMVGGGGQKAGSELDVKCVSKGRKYAKLLFSHID